MSDDLPKVRKIGDKLILDDPGALEIIKAVAKHNCQITYETHYDRVKYFHGRIQELGRSPEDVVVVLVNADDGNGGPLSEVLMPNANWQEYRERGEIPYARGLALKKDMIFALGIFDAEAADKLEAATGPLAVVVDFGVAEVFTYVEFDDPVAAP